MSTWTYLNISISAQAYAPTRYGESRHQRSKRVATILNKLPKITGREGNANVRFFILPRHNSSIHFSRGRSKHEQTGITISITGSLRDRHAERTIHEVKEFLRALKEEIYIDGGIVSIRDTFSNQVIATIDNEPSEPYELKVTNETPERGLERWTLGHYYKDDL